MKQCVRDSKGKSLPTKNSIPSQTHLTQYEGKLKMLSDRQGVNKFSTYSPPKDGKMGLPRCVIVKVETVNMHMAPGIFFGTL